MNALRFTLRPLSAFGTPLAGDTLFGHLCWALAMRHGQDSLESLLAGYTEGDPFAVLSDAFPAGLLPRPLLPSAVSGLQVSARERKALRRLQWLPAKQYKLPLAEWLQTACAGPVGRPSVSTQNTINRLTGTTGTGPFAPRQVEQIVFPADTMLEVYVLHDPARLSEADLQQALDDIGQGGFGRDASAGLGKFDIVDRVASPIDTSQAYRHVMTLAPCAPAVDELDAGNCFYQPVTRFGRHGNVAALGSGGGPFKRPVLMARTAAMLTYMGVTAATHHGCGLGGVLHPLSGVIPATVHQGYAPLVPLNLEVFG